MRKKHLLLCCILALVSAEIGAVSFHIGIEGGYDYNIYDIKSQYAYDLRYKNSGGLTIGVPTFVRFNDWVGLRTDLVYQQKNYSMHRSGLLSKSQTNHINHYLQLPIMVNFSFGGERLRGYLNVGGYIGGWLASHRQGTNALSGHNYSVPHKFDEKREFTPEDYRFDAGLAGSIGLVCRVNNRLALFLEAGCNYSMLSTHKITKNMVSPNPTYNTTVFVQFGILITASAKKKSIEL